MRLALHSVSYSGAWPGQVLLPLERVVDKAAEFGYDGVELVAKRPHASPLDLTPDDRRRLRDRIAARNLELCCLAGYFDFSDDGAHGDLAHLQKELLWMRETLRLASDLGAPIVRTYSGHLYPTVPYQQQWERCVQGLRESAQMAGDFGVVLALQNHSEVTFHHRDVIEMIREVDSPHLRAVIEATPLHMSGEAIEQAVMECGELIVHTHLSDRCERPTLQWAPNNAGYYNVTRWRATLLGEGEIDYRTFVRALRSTGYKGFLSYEICGPIAGGGSEENLDLACQKAQSYMSSLLAES